MTRPLTLLSLLALGCGTSDPAAPQDPSPDPTCAGLFGAPNENTGLDQSACFPFVEGDDGRWDARAWDAAAIASLRAWTLLDPPAVPEEDPYQISPEPQPDEDSVCALLPEESGDYRVETFASVEAATAAGGSVTHGGACGLCSSLADLAVYAEQSDLTEPVRQCGLEGVIGGFEDTETCLLDLGFTPPCARIWAYNTEHTRESCFDLCITALDDPYHEADGSLNACLQCDEDESGPVFKAVAGRTRRNSGLATALCRPCETVWRIDHVASAPR